MWLVSFNNVIFSLTLLKRAWINACTVFVARQPMKEPPQERIMTTSGRVILLKIRSCFLGWSRSW